jgi:hypothetical protein
MELPEISLPTDNLYKSLFCLGFMVIVFSLFPFYCKHKVEIDKIRLAGEIEDLENKNNWLEEDGQKYEEEMNSLGKLIKGEFKEVPRLDPNTEEYKKFCESIGEKVDPNNPNPIFIIDIHKTKQAVEKKNEIIRDTQEKLRNTRNELTYTARNISISNVQIITKKKEVSQTDEFTAYLLKLGILGIISGTVLVIYGGYNWWNKTQKWQDRSLAKQAKLKKSKE